MSQRNCNYCNTELVRFRKDENGNWHRYEDNQMTVEHTYKRCKAIQLEKKNYVAPAPEGQSQLPKQLTNPPPQTAPSQQPNQNSNQAFYSVLNKCKNLETELVELRKMFETQASIIDSMAQKITLLVEKVGYPEPRPAIKELVEQKDNIPSFQDLAGPKQVSLQQQTEPKPIDPEKEDIEKNEAREWEYYGASSDNRPCKFCGKTFIGAGWHKRKTDELCCYECGMNGNTIKDQIGEPCARCGKPSDLNINPAEPQDTPLLCSECFTKQENEAFQKTQEMIKKDLNSEWEMISEKFVCSGCDQVFHNGWQHFSDVNYCDDCKTNIEAKKAWQSMSEERTRNRTIESINMEDDDVSF